MVCGESGASAFFLVRNSYSDPGCWSESSRMSSAIVSLISDCIMPISRYTRCRSGSDAYSSCSNNSHRFSVSVSSCSRSSNTAKVFSWKATAHVVIRVKVSSVLRSMWGLIFSCV